LAHADCRQQGTGHADQLRWGGARRRWACAYDDWTCTSRLSGSLRFCGYVLPLSTAPAAVGSASTLQACWAGKGLLYDLEYDLPASRFPYADNAVGSDFTGTGSGGTTWAMAEKHDLKNFQHVMAERKHDLTQLQLRHEQSFKVCPWQFVLAFSSANACSPSECVAGRGLAEGRRSRSHESA
jgi:hypothetical protein